MVKQTNDPDILLQVDEFPSTNDDKARPNSLWLRAIRCPPKVLKNLRASAREKLTYRALTKENSRDGHTNYGDESQDEKKEH